MAIKIIIRFSCKEKHPSQKKSHFPYYLTLAQIITLCFSIPRSQTSYHFMRPKLLLLLLSHLSRVQLMWSHRWQPTRPRHPWDSPGKNTGVGCDFLPQCMKVKSESEVVQSCLTLRVPMDCSLPDSSVHGIFQARELEWGAIAFSWGPKGAQNSQVEPEMWRSLDWNDTQWVRYKAEPSSMRRRLKRKWNRMKPFLDD